MKIGIIKSEETTRAVFGNKKLQLSLYSSNEKKVGRAFDVYIKQIPNLKEQVNFKSSKDKCEHIKPSIILSFKNLEGIDILLKDLYEIRELLVASEEREKKWSETQK